MAIIAIIIQIYKYICKGMQEKIPDRMCRGSSNEYPNLCFEQKYETNPNFIWKLSVFSGEFFQYIWIGVFSKC